MGRGKGDEGDRVGKRVMILAIMLCGTLLKAARS